MKAGTGCNIKIEEEGGVVLKFTVYMDQMWLCEMVIDYLPVIFITNNVSQLGIGWMQGEVEKEGKGIGIAIQCLNTLYTYFPMDSKI